MPGNQAIFDRAMEQYQDAVRQGDWNRALKEAAQAMQEFPRHDQARTAAATALFHADKLPQALQLFSELSASDPNNPTYLEYIGRIKRQQGDSAGAIALLLQLAERQIEAQQMSKAIRAYREILEIDQRHAEGRIRLAMLLADSGDKPAAIREYLTVGQHYLDSGDVEAAAEAATEALGVDPNSLSAKEFQKKVEAAQVVELPDAPDGPWDGRSVPRTPEQFEQASANAIELQNASQHAESARIYELLMAAQPDRPDVQYSLGLLYDELGRYDEALKVLESATHNDEYALSAHYAMGTVYQKVDKLERAAQEFEQAIRYVDLQSIGKDEAADLIDMYEITATIYQDLGDIARAASLYSTLAGFLQGKRWGAEQAVEYNTKAKDLTERNMMSKLRMLGTGALQQHAPNSEPEPLESVTETWGRIPSITDFLAPKRPGEAAEAPAASLDALLFSGSQLTDIDPLDVLAATLPEPESTQYAPLSPIDTSDRSESIQRLVEASEHYAEQQLFYAAIDACHEVIKADLEFYPIHLRMGEILERIGRPDEALTKFELLIETYKARGEFKKAIDVYYRLIDLSNDSVSVRGELADLLRTQGRVGDAAEQLGLVASQHFRMGQTNKALEEFRRALEWAPDSPALRAQYGQTLLKLERWEAALDEFRRVLGRTPNDLVVMAQVNIALAMLGEFPDAIWDSLAALAEKLREQPNAANDVQSEYRSILMVNERPILHFILGLLQQASQQHSGALLSFELALELLESDPDPLLPALLVHQAMADCHIALGNAADSIRQLQRIEGILATASMPPLGSKHSFASTFSEGELQRRLAEAYAAGDNLEGAIAALQKVKQLIPYDRAAYTKLSDIYFRQGRLPDAMAQLDELASYYESQGQLDRALETLELALKLAPNNIPIKSRFVQMQLRRGYLDQGLAGLDDLAEMQRKQGQIKDAVGSIQQAADIYWTLGQIQKAADMYNRIVQIAPNDTEARQQLVSFNILSLRTNDAITQLREIARLSIQQRNYEEAIASYHQVIALNQKDPDAYEQLGDVLMRVGEYAQAVRVYKQLAKLVPDDDRVEVLQNAAQRMLDQQQAASA